MIIVVRCNVLTLMQKQLDILLCILKCIIHQLELLGANVIVVQTMNNQRWAIKVVVRRGRCSACLAIIACGIVTGCPVRAVVTIQRNLIIVNTVEICWVNILDGFPFCIVLIQTSVNIAPCTIERGASIPVRSMVTPTSKGWMLANLLLELNTEHETVQGGNA